MCGIVGAVALRNVTPVLLQGLRRLEYRGYDSAGIAVLSQFGLLRRVRCVGKVQKLEDFLKSVPLNGDTGIAHLRWATHGVPTEANAHPHISGNFEAVVHNGIVENHEELRATLKAHGYSFQSETDTEVIAHLIRQEQGNNVTLLEAVRNSVTRLHGTYAIGVISIHDPYCLIAARRGSPLVIGIGRTEHFIASDVFALLEETRRFIFLEDGDIARLSPDSVDIYDADGKPVFRPIREVLVEAGSGDRGGYAHHMLKEIHEQPKAVLKTLEARVANGHVLPGAFGPKMDTLLPQVKAVQIVACGTSYHAGLVARYWLETLAGVPCDVEVASEFRYRKHIVRPGTLLLTISQSGETADTLAALREAKHNGYLHTFTICNVPESSLVRESASALMTRAGPEIGVASTKAFTTQLTALLLLVVALGSHNGMSPETEFKIVEELEDLSNQMNLALELEADIRRWASRLADRQHAIYLGRGAQYPVAMEGALKLKEISYIHAEDYPAGELKHGPLALVDKNMPVVAVAPNDGLLEKLKSNLQEVKARGGELFVITDADTALQADRNMEVIRLAKYVRFTAPIIYAVPLQMLAYHVALIKGTDLDQPRNLAKSVTVE